MDKKALRVEITHLIDSIKEHSDMITPHERISQLELELILSKIKKLYEKSIVFNYLNGYEQTSNNPFAKYVSNDWEEEEEDVTKKTKENDEIEQELIHHKSTFDLKTEEQESIVNESAEIFINVKLKEETKQKTEEKAEEKAEATAPNSKNIELSLANKINKTPVAVLIRAMGINDRFLFIKELFKGDNEKFKETVTQLNELKSFEEADTFIKQNIASKYNWDYKSMAVSNFMDLIERRFL